MPRKLDFSHYWPKGYELRIYFESGAFRDVLPKGMDLVDYTMGLGRPNKFIFGFKSKNNTKQIWEDEDLCQIEQELRNDFREDGYRLRLKRIVGLGQNRSDAALWRVTAY